jgi:hypothetical protein
MGHVNGDDDGVGYGVRGRGTINTTGVRGLTGNAVFDPNVDQDAGVFGKGGSNERGDDGLVGVFGVSEFRAGVYGKSTVSMGVYGESNSSFGVYGSSDTDVGVIGTGVFDDGVNGQSNSGNGVAGNSYSGAGVAGVSFGEGSDGVGVAGASDNFFGVSGVSMNSTGVYGESGGENAFGVVGVTTKKGGIGVVGGNTNRGHMAGWFNGNVRVTGNINKSALYFQIDHPLDPANKYLNHSSIESTDMKNLYDGVVALDEKGEAKINLPGWFGALNKDFRYQLTAIGAPGPNLYIAEEISESNTDYSKNNSNKNNNSGFKIGGGTSGMKVSWQITGVRKDPYAKAHPIQVEEDKPDKERGYYIHPDLYDEPAEKGIDRLIFSVSSLEKVYKPLDKLKTKKRSPPK